MQWSVYKVMAGETASSSDVTNGARQQRQQAVEDKLPRPELCLVPGCTVRLADEGVRSTRVKVCGAHQKCGSVVVEGEASRFCQQCVRFHPLTDYDGDRKGCRRSLKLHNLRRKRRAAELRGSCVVIESKCHDETPQMSPDVVVPTTHHRGRKEARREAQRSDSSAVPTTLLQTSSSSQPFPCAPNLDELSGECSGLYLEPDWNSPMGLSVEMSPADCSRATCSTAVLAEVSTPGDTSLIVGGAAAVNNNTPFYSRPSIRYQWPDALLERSLELWEGGPGDETLHSCVGPGCAICSTYNTIPHPPHQLASWTADTTDSSSDLAPFHPDLEHPPHHLGFTAKIHNVTPYDLPRTMRDDLSSMLQGLPMSMEGAIRPGCVMLSLDCWFKSRADCQAALASFMATLGSATTGTSRLPWGPHDADIYLPNFVALLRNGSVVQWKPRSASPTIVSCHTCASATGEVVSLAVKDAVTDDFKLLARLNGKYFEADIVSVNRSPDGTLSIQARVPTQNPGLLWLEFLQDAAPSHALLSPPVPVLLTHRADVAQEVSMYTLTKHKPASQELVATLKALDETLHFDKAALPQLEQWCTAVQLAAMLGWQATLAVIFEEADEYGFLQDYVTELNQRCNLVASAALSGCLETMIQVIMVLEQAEIPLSVSNEMVINRVPFTALHIAAMQGAADVCRMLCSLCPEASLAWDTVLAGPSEQTPAAIVHRRLIHRNSQPSSSIKADDARAPEFDVSEKTKHSPEIDGYQLEETQQDVVPSRFHSIAWHIRDWKFACVTFLLFLVIGYNQGMRELEGTMLSALLTAVLHIGVPLYATHHFTVCAHAHEEAKERGMELERNTLYFVDSDVRADFMLNSRLSRVFPNSHHFLFLLCVMWPLGLASEEPLSLLRFMYVVFLLPGAILPCLGLTCASAQGILWVNILLDASTQVAPALSCWLSNIDAPEPVLTQPPGNPPFLTCLAFLMKSLMNVSICAAVRGLIFRYPSRWMHMGQTIVAACLPLSFLQRYVYSGGCAACTDGALPTLLLLPLLSVTSILVSLQVRHDMERSRVLTYLLNYTSTSKPKQA